MLVNNFMVRDITSVQKDTDIEYLIKILYRHRRNTLPVVDSDNKIIGTISIEEILHESIPAYFHTMKNAAFLPDVNQFTKKLKEISSDRVEKYMVTDFVATTEDDTITHVADMMIKSDLKTLFVTKNNVLRGYINRIDLISSILKE